MGRDADLGREIHTHLEAQGLETPFNPEALKNEAAQDEIRDHYAIIMLLLGLDLTNDSLRETPQRVAKMYCQEVYQGLDYRNFPACTTVENKMNVDEMVAIKATVKSMCEHHAQPFIGLAHIAYIPKTKILGLSKFNRVVDFFSRRPQIQERLTEQISAALRYILETEDVAVVIQAKHFCVALRGVQDHVSDTTTSKMCGRFRTVDALRAEFLALTRNSNGK
jgi:GTP cyclohydrolase I